MLALVSDLTAWHGLEPPIRVGPARTGTITISQLSTRHGYELITTKASGPDLTRRSRQLRPLHLAVQAATQLLAPVFADGIWVEASPCQLAIMVSAHAEALEFWLEPDARARTCPGASAVGAAIGGLLVPVTRMVSRCSRIHERAVSIVAAESVIAGLYRAARSAGRIDDTGWLDEASAAVAKVLGVRVTAERLRCHPDTGPAVMFPARRLCCVLNSGVSLGSCPGCPKTGTTSDQARNATTWLAAMNDEEFLKTTGRFRMADPPADQMAGLPLDQ